MAEGIVLEGRVRSGMGEGARFVGMTKYQERFKEGLGFQAFPGTLNVRIDSLDGMKRLRSLRGIMIEGFRKGEKDFGVVECFPCTVNSVDGAVIVPERTRHEPDIIEVISRHNLRERLGLADGDSAEIVIK